jgi:hypothetical protein
MSCRRRCDFWKATDGKWYMLLGKFEDADEESDCEAFGPFSSSDAAQTYLRNNHSNPGSFSEDDSGTRPPPKKLTASWRLQRP